MGWFGSYAVSAEVQDWIENSFDWAAMNAIMTPKSPLVLPTKQFFPARSGTTDEVVFGLVNNLKRMLGLRNLKITLAPIEVLPDALRHQFGQMSDVAGTWQGDGKGAPDPALTHLPSRVARMLIRAVKQVAS